MGGFGLNITSRFPPSQDTMVERWQSVFGDSAPTASGGTAPPSGTTSQQQADDAVLRAMLAPWGLSNLAERLLQQQLAGVPLEQILLDLRRAPEYQARFPGMKRLEDLGRAISEDTYISVERAYAQNRRMAGLPPGFYDSPDDFGHLIANEVSPVEDAERLQLYTSVANEFGAVPENRPILDQLQRLYGITPDSGAFVAYVADPARALPVLQQQFAAGRLAATARRTGFDQLSRAEAERLAAQGVTEQQAAEGFGQLVDSQELFSPLNRAEDAIGRDEQLGAAFGGDARARRRIQRRAERRRAEFEGGGGFATGRAGVGGVGEAS